MKPSLFQIGFCALFSAVCLHAQEASSAGVVGQVTDSSQAGVPGAMVRITNLGTNAQRSTTTDTLGNFSLPNLPPARYEIRIEKEGFRTAIVEPFELRIGEIARRTVTLTVGGVAESVLVTAEAPLMQTESGTVGQVIGEKQIAELPLNGRNLTQLAALSAGVSPRQSLQRGTTQYGERNMYVTIEGGRDSSTNYVIDGVYVRSLRFNNLSLQPSVDTIQEFNVLRNSFSSEYGQGQSVVTAVTRSGTNEFHGTLFEFVRNDKLDARNFFAARKPAYRRNQFGGTAGGPVIRNKFFIFGGYEGLRTVQGRPFPARVPDPALLTGDLSSISSPILDPMPGSAAFNLPFPGNRIPASRISRFASVLSPTIPAPNAAGANNYLVTRNFLDDWNNVTFRADQTLTPKHSLFERYIWYDASQTGPAAFYDTKYPQGGQNLSVGETWLITPSLVNEFRLGYNRANNIWLPQSLEGKNWTQLAGLQNLAAATDPIDFGRPSFAIAGFSTQGEGPYTHGAIENLYSISDALSKVYPKHTLRMGVQAQNRRFFHITEVLPRGSFTFDGKFSGNAIADYLLGLCSQCTGALGSSRSNYRSNTLSLFVNDEWRVSSRLTLTLGLRYEYLGWWREINNLEGSFDPISGKIAYHKAPKDLPPALAPLVINRDNFYPAGIVYPDKNNWGPRVGFAYRPSNKFVVRSAFGVYYDNPNLNELQFTRLLPPFYGTRTIIPDKSAPILIDTLFPDLSRVTSFPAPFATMPDNRVPYVMQWNFNLQRMLWKDMIAEIAYTGSGGRKLPRRFNQNQADFGTTPIVQRLPYPNFDPGIFTAVNDSLSNFNALSVRVEKRYSQGLYFLANYQFSKNIDDNSGEVDNAVAYRTNRRLNRGLSRYDQRHRAVGSFGYELPAGRGKRWLSQGGPAGFLLGNWQVQGIVTLLSGLPFGASGPPVCDCGSYVSQWVNAVKPGFGRLENPTPNRWFDVSAFALPPRGFQGNAGRNFIEGPGLRTFDFSTGKNFEIGERIRAQFRAEFFNLFNHPSFGYPTSDITSGNAGVISSAYDGRSIQFGLKLLW